MRDRDAHPIHTIHYRPDLDNIGAHGIGYDWKRVERHKLEQKIKRDDMAEKAEIIGGYMFLACFGVLPILLIIALSIKAICF
jgi:hypothetical protein